MEKKNEVRIFARCSECLETIEVVEVEGSSLNSIMVTVKTGHDCLTAVKP